jgi:hypothetical protein
MLDTSGLRDEEIILFKDFYKEVTSNFRTEIIDDLDIPFKTFELFKGYRSIEHRQSLQINNSFGKAYLAIIQVEYNYIGSKGYSFSHLEFQVWGFASLSTDFGHLYIRPETFTDKIVEFFNHIEIDFPDDKIFSDRFYVLSKDRQKAEHLLGGNFRTALKETELKQFQLEILNTTLVLGENKTIANCDIKALGNLLLKVTDINF